MIKRSFFALSQPRLTYDLLEPDPKAPETIPVPANLTLLLNEAINSSRQAIIKTGDPVKKGEKLKLYEDSTAYCVSPVAGTIKLIDSFSDDFGNLATYIIVTHDPGKTADIEDLEFEEDLSFAGQHLGTLPGAPPLGVLANSDINTIVVTCSDADLLTTTCQYVGAAYGDELKEGLRILKRLANVANICVAVPDGLATRTSFDTARVLTTAVDYPQALPAMIMKDHLDKVLTPGQTPEDMGVCFMGAEAVVSLARAYKDKAPVFDKVVTLIDKTGTRYRIRATIGTPLSKIFTHYNIHINDQDRLIIGGPMQGFATFTPHHPVTADMDTVLIQDQAIIPELSDYPCVNCGKCIQVCPANIPVNLLVRFLEVDQYEEAADKYDLQSCIECGLCAYVCTARIPLYQYIRLGKHELLKLRADA